MSDFSLTLVMRLTTSKIINDVAKVQMKSEKITPFGGIFHVRELFSRIVAPIIDKVLGLRCTSYGYQYGEIAGSLASIYFCGGDSVEDVTSHLMPHLSLHPTLRTAMIMQIDQNLTKKIKLDQLGSSAIPLFALLK